MMERVTDPNLISQLDSLRSSQSQNQGQQVTDPDLINQLDQIRLGQSQTQPQSQSQPFTQGIDPFLINPQNANQSLYQEMGSPSAAEMGKSALQGAGTLGLLMPGVDLVEGGALFPNIINTLGHIGQGSIFGAMSQPDHPAEGAEMGAFAPAIIGALSRAPALFSKTSPQYLGSLLQGAHDDLLGSAKDLFNEVGSSVENRNIGQIPIRKSVFDQIENNNYLPNTLQNKKLLNNAKSGDYSSLRDLQSDLFSRGTAALKSNFQADINKGEEMMDVRDTINNSIIGHLEDTGNEDLADKLQDAVNKYRIVKQTYFSNKLPSAIKNMFHPDSREIPNNLLTTLSRNSIPINNLKSLNPVINEILSNANIKSNMLNTLKFFAKSAPFSAGTFGIGELLNRHLNEQDQQ